MLAPPRTQLILSVCVFPLSFGIILWELLTQMIPYEDKDFETVAGLVSRLPSPALNNAQRARSRGRK